MTPRALGGALVTALLVPGFVSCSSGSEAAPAVPSGSSAASGDEAAPAELVAPARFRTRLEHRERPRSDGLVDWRTDWVLRWDEVPGATAYTVRFATSEGGGGRERTLDEPLLTLDVAAGTSPRARVRPDREAQLTLTASQLLVSVVPTAAGGEGPPSPWFRVGEAPADGVPVPNDIPEHH